MNDPRPNILLITADQQRFDSLGCYGARGVCTPTLDRLARDGVRFESCYANNPVCTPSRASLWTGKHVPGHGVHALHDCLAEDETLFPFHLRAAGYDTALLGKLHVSGHVREAVRRHPRDGFRVYEWTPDPHGFTGADTAYHRWLAEHYPEVLERFRRLRVRPGHLPIEAHMTTWAADRAIAFLERDREKDRPFFCCMSVFDPHDPYCNYPLEMRARLNEAELSDVVAWDEPLQGRPLAHRRSRDGCYLADMRELTLDEVRTWRVGYHAAVALIDLQVERVLRALDELGLSQNTLVLFTSDHGDMLGDHGLLVKGCYFYDACTRVPLIVRAPGRLPAGTVVRELCQIHDIAATALLAAGLSADQVRRWMPDARDLLQTESLRARGFAACLHRNSDICVDRVAGTKGYFDPPLHATMWREGDYKLNIYHAPPPGPGDAPGELFNLRADPIEVRNLWSDPAHREIRDSLQRRMLDWLVEQSLTARARGESAMPDSAAYSRPR